MAAVALFGAQIAAQTRDIFAIRKIVTISNINHHHKTHLGYFILFSFRTFVIIIMTNVLNII